MPEWMYYAEQKLVTHKNTYELQNTTHKLLIGKWTLK